VTTMSSDLAQTAHSSADIPRERAATVLNQLFYSSRCRSVSEAEAELELYAATPPPKLLL